MATQAFIPVAVSPSVPAASRWKREAVQSAAGTRPIEPGPVR